MASLLAAAAFFVLLHLLVSGTRLRDAITGVVGQGPYMGLFSLASVAGLVWLGFAFAGARGTEDNTVFWSVTAATRDVQFVLQFLASLLVVIGLATPNPTSVRQEGVLLVMCFLWLPEGMFGGIAMWIERLTSKKSNARHRLKAAS